MVLAVLDQHRDRVGVLAAGVDALYDGFDVRMAGVELHSHLLLTASALIDVRDAHLQVVLALLDDGHPFVGAVLTARHATIELFHQVARRAQNLLELLQRRSRLIRRLVCLSCILLGLNLGVVGLPCRILCRNFGVVSMLRGLLRGLFGLVRVVS